jgi:hypothetical protein
MVRSASLYPPTDPDVTYGVLVAIVSVSTCLIALATQLVLDVHCNEILLVLVIQLVVILLCHAFQLGESRLVGRRLRVDILHW